jgi:hypothetical protein
MSFRARQKLAKHELKLSRYSGQIREPLRPTAALRAPHRGPVPVCPTLSARLHLGAAAGLSSSSLANGGVYAGSSFELLEFLRDRNYRESQLALVALCARALGASLPAQVEKGQGAYVSLIKIGKRLCRCGRPTERAHTESLKKRLRISRRARCP